jgi:hypothetical protein
MPDTQQISDSTADAFLKLGEDEQRETLKRLSPATKQALLSYVKAHPAKAPAAQPDFFDRAFKRVKEAVNYQVPRPPGGGEEMELATGAGPGGTALATLGTAGNVFTNPVATLKALAGSAALGSGGAALGKRYLGDAGEALLGTGGMLLGGYLGGSGKVDLAKLPTSRAALLEMILGRGKVAAPETPAFPVTSEQVKPEVTSTSKPSVAAPAGGPSTSPMSKINIPGITAPEPEVAAPGKPEVSKVSKGPGLYRGPEQVARAQRAADLEVVRQHKAFQSQVREIEAARQKEISDWAKVDKATEAEHRAFSKRVSDLEGERQRKLAELERFKEQHAASLNRRSATESTEAEAETPSPATKGAPTKATTPVTAATKRTLEQWTEEALWSEYMKNRGRPLGDAIAKELARRGLVGGQ